MGDRDDAAATLAALGALFAVECGTLDVGERRGWTGYIDFIRPEELGDARVVKGTDASGRRFVAFKCTAHGPRGPHRLFTTLFQRYHDDPTLYHTAGHHGTHLLTTTGGASLAQVERILELLRAGRVDLTVDDMTTLRVVYRDHDEVARLDPATVDAVVLGWAGA